MQLLTGSGTVRGILRAIVALARRHGAEYHPGCWIQELEGGLSLHCDAAIADGAGVQVLRLPHCLLVPLDGIVWRPGLDRPQRLENPAGLTALHHEMLDLHSELFASAGHLQRTAEQSPGWRLGGVPAIAGAVAALRRGELPSFPTVMDALLATRAVAWTGPAGSRQSVLAPIIDCANHSPDAGHFTPHPDALAATMTRRLPDDECRVAYGRNRDALDLALRYGFFDEQASVAHSCPLELDLPGLGRVEVLGERYRVEHPMDPPQVSIVYDRLTISHVCCQSRHPARTRAMLRLLLSRLAHSRGLRGTAATETISDLFAAIAAINRERLEALIRACDAVVDEARWVLPLMQAARHQGGIITQTLAPG